MPGGGGQSIPQMQQQQGAAITPVKPPWYPDPMRTGNEPGQLQGLATDMAAGGFGNATADLGWLRNVFRPVDSMAYNKPEGAKAPAKKVVSKSKVPLPLGKTGGNDPVQRVPTSPAAPGGMTPQLVSDGRGGAVWAMVPDLSRPPAKNGLPYQIAAMINTGRNNR
jgi:hypothetical protein